MLGALPKAFPEDVDARVILPYYSTIPEGGPELIINVPYTIEGKVAVRYVDDSGGCSSDDAL